MSRSIRNRHSKNGVYLKIGGDSDKRDKRIANRRFRRQESREAHVTLIQGEDYFTINNIKDVSNTWEFASDGLAYYIALDDTRRWYGPIPKNERYKYKAK